MTNISHPPGSRKPRLSATVCRNIRSRREQKQTHCKGHTQMAIAYPIRSSPSVPWRCALAAGSDDTDAHRTKTETDRRRIYVTAIIKRVFLFFRFTRAKIFFRNSKTARLIFATVAVGRFKRRGYCTSALAATATIPAPNTLGRSWAAYRARLPLRSTSARGPFPPRCFAR